MKEIRIPADEVMVTMTDATRLAIVQMIEGGDMPERITFNREGFRQALKENPTGELRLGSDPENPTFLGLPYSVDVKQIDPVVVHAKE